MVVIALGPGRMRFGDLRTTVDGISGKVLTETLRDLQRDGILTRHVYAEIPPRVEYELTELGHTLHVPLRALGRWAEEHIAEVLVARETWCLECLLGGGFPGRGQCPAMNLTPMTTPPMTRLISPLRIAAIAPAPIRLPDT